MGRSWRQAGSYAARALRVLCQHPSVLLVAVAMAAFTTLQSQGLTYLQLSRQRPVSETKNPQAREFEKSFPLVLHRMDDPTTSALLVLYPSETPTVSLDLAGLVREATGGRTDWRRDSGTGRPELPSSWALLVPLSLAVAFGLSTLIAGGYLGAVGRAATEDRPRWDQLLSDGRRFFWRLIILSSVDWGLMMGAIAILLLRFYHVLPPALMILPIACMVTAFSLGLARFAVVTDDVSLVRAIRQSVSTVWRNLPVALTLMGGSGALGLCLWRIGLGPHAARMMTGTPASRGEEVLHFAPIFLASACLASALAAWFCTAMLLWYREARPDDWALRRVAGDSPQEEEAAELASGGPCIVCGGCGKTLPPGVNLCPDCNSD
jgi:hypothetical protein